MNNYKTNTMKRELITLTLLLSLFSVINAQPSILDLPVRGMTIGAPSADQVDRFNKFIDNELSKTDLNLLVLRINYNYQFKSHPELAEENALDENQVKSILAACRRNNIELVPLLNLLGHQSWKQDNIRSLLKVYPEFEENPGEKLKRDDFYCRSYCPLHPNVHKVVFSLLDEIAEVFESKAIHVGLDEVFILGEDGCPRCKGIDKAILFGDEVNRIYKHLKTEGLKMYIWGDRLIDGRSTGLGMWQAAVNETHPAIDLISKEVIICDWHYKVAPPTASYFAVKGFDVISCSHQIPEVAVQQVEEMLRVRSTKSGLISDHMLGVMHTSWGSASDFMDGFAGKECSEKTAQAVKTFKTIFQ